MKVRFLKLTKDTVLEPDKKYLCVDVYSPEDIFINEIYARTDNFDRSVKFFIGYDNGAYDHLIRRVTHYAELPKVKISFEGSNKTQNKW